MKLKLVSNTNGSSHIDVKEKIFDREFNSSTLHQVVNSTLATRKVTKAQKTRSQVRGGGRKPWKQKGTGNARAGTNTSPIWTGGGNSHAAAPRDVHKKINKKMYKAAMQIILSELNRQDRLKVTDSIDIAEPKTKHMVKFLGQLGIQKVLIVLDTMDENVYLSARNIPNVTVKLLEEVSPMHLISYDNVLATVAAVKKFEEVLA